jgi:hypothetical protein
MRQTLQTLFGFDLSTGQKWIIAFAVILVLLALLGLFARQIKGGRLRIKGQGGGRARQPRLGVVDMYDLDRQRQLILIRRDNVEHLVMIGGTTDVVVETNIMRSGARAQAAAPVEFVQPERTVAPDILSAAEPPAAADLLPPLPTRPAQPQPPVRAAPPQKPVEPPVAAAIAATAAVVAAPAVAALARNEDKAPPAPVEVPTPSVQPPSFARDHAPSPAASAVELDDMTRQLEEALKRPYSAVRPAQPASTEPVIEAPPVVAPARQQEPTIEPPKIEVPPIVPAPAMAEAEPEPEATSEPVVEELPPLPPPSPPAPPAATGKPIRLPADVEAELEIALGLKPERVSPFADRPAPPTPPLLEAPVFEEPGEPEPQPAAAAPEVIVTPPPAPEPEPIEPVIAAKEPVVEEVAPAEAEPAAPAAPPPPKPAAIDPFSVDAIEAEFARLLGRDPKKG